MNTRFHILPWHGDYNWSPGSAFNGLHYQHNVWFAQRTAGALKRYVEAAQPDSSKRVFMTHSLGNMVACEALREGLLIGKYFMFAAAVPSEEIDGTLRAEDAARMIADGLISSNAVFNRDFSPMFDHDASQDDQWLAVAKYVPAVSSPVGGRAVMVDCITENVNMNVDSDNGGVSRHNRWGRNSPDWQHSDMKDMAYFYVYKLYEQLIQKGGLK